MNEPKLITQRDRIREVADKWAQQYMGYSASDPKRSVILPRLRALDLETATPEDVAAIIGNSSWTDLRCSGCDEYVSEIVQVGEEPDYESSTANLCRACMAKAAALFDLPLQSRENPREHASSTQGYSDLGERGGSH